MDLESIVRVLIGLPIGPIRYYQQIGSTNSEAASWADRGAPNLALVIADEQTAGRGRYGRKWYTPPCSALAFSLILRFSNQYAAGRVKTTAFPENITRLTALGSLAVCQALRTKIDLPAQIKWPNDVLIKRRKVAGILAEAQWQGDLLNGVILGIGINVTPESVPHGEEIVFPATCVQSELGRPTSRLELLRTVLECLLKWQTRWTRPEFLHTWEELLAFRGEWVNIITESDSNERGTHLGQVLGLDNQGSLRLLDRAGQEFRLCMGEIRLRPIELQEKEAEILIQSG